VRGHAAERAIEGTDRGAGGAGDHDIGHRWTPRMGFRRWFPAS
jgi:hypothetical protein